MTTKPKAKKFRIRRGAATSGPDSNSSQTSEASANTNLLASEAGDEDGFGDLKFSNAASDDNNAQIDLGPTDLAQIKQEGLTGRQLRMARRVAQKHGMAPTSDFDAVRLLRLKGIDPFQRAALLDLVAPEDKSKSGTPNLPKTIEPENVPSTEVMTEDSRATDILRIQTDIARRRRKQMLLLFTRLSFFVLLPTVIFGYYFYVIATPLYATKSEFLIQQAEAQGGGGGGLGGLLSGTGLATSQDSIAVQSYLQSREAMLRLDADIGFKKHFSQDFVDPLTRLEADSTNEKAYRLFKKLVKIGYDPTEGIVKMEVIATSPDISREYSLALIDYAEEQVDNLTQRLREDQMKGARESFVTSENKMLESQNKVLELQERLGVIDPASETSAVMSQVTNFETQVQQKNLVLQQLLDNERPNQARVDGVKGDISRLEALINDLRSQLTEDTVGNTSLARIGGQLRIAELDLQTRQAMMQQALQQLENARMSADRQVRYLSLGVSPIAPDEPTYPRAFENTMVTFLVFAGIYLMASLTTSILREQVSS